ncbi:MAG: hypothetical protein ACJAYX_003581 [Planctomycetota bacterium]|jgi:hypothetical protein
MRNSKDIIRESLTYAREQRGRSWWHLISTLSLVLALGATICVFSSWLILLPASIVLGLTLVRMFIIYHDFQHGTILKRSKVGCIGKRAGWVWRGVSSWVDGWLKGWESRLVGFGWSAPHFEPPVREHATGLWNRRKTAVALWFVTSRKRPIYVRIASAEFLDGADSMLPRERSL